jgi:hypothetical protein
VHPSRCWPSLCWRRSCSGRFFDRFPANLMALPTVAESLAGWMERRCRCPCRRAKSGIAHRQLIDSSSLVRFQSRSTRRSW